MDSTGSDALKLAELIRGELSAIPFDMWGYFFPCQVGVWRFIELKRPGVLGELKAGYDSEPYFKGKGSTWFCDVLFNDEEYVPLVEDIMYSVVESLKSNHPNVFAKGSLSPLEVPQIAMEKTQHLAAIVLGAVDKALITESIS